MEERFQPRDQRSRKCEDESYELLRAGDGSLEGTRPSVDSSNREKRVATHRLLVGQPWLFSERGPKPHPERAVHLSTSCGTDHCRTEFQSFFLTASTGVPPGRCPSSSRRSTSAALRLLQDRLEGSGDGEGRRRDAPGRSDLVPDCSPLGSGCCVSGFWLGSAQAGAQDAEGLGWLMPPEAFLIASLFGALSAGRTRRGGAADP